MSLQVLKYNFTISSFVSLQDLKCFQEFLIFKEFKKFNVLQSIKEFSNIPNIQFSKSYKKLKEFRSLQEFQEFLKYFSFITYYKDLQLLLCSSCLTFISSTFYKGHFPKHFIGFKGRENDKVSLKAISILNKLQVNSLLLSLDLILSFSNSNSLPLF